MLIDEFSKCNRILNNKSIIGRFKNKSAIPFAKEKQTELMTQIASLIGQHYKSEEMDEFLEKVLPLSEEAKTRMAAILSDKPKSEPWERNFMQEIVNYCYEVYEIANIPMDSTDAEYFYSFDMLKRLSIRSHLADLFDKYKDYIFSNQ